MQDVQVFIDNLAQKWQQNACKKLLDSQLKADTNIVGAIKWQNPYFSYNGQALIKWYCAKSWVNVYFFKGRMLGDPNHLFEKTGNKTMRTIKLFEDTKLDKDAYERLVKDALRLNK